jgi:GTP cyclohydrolase I
LSAFSEALRQRRLRSSKSSRHPTNPLQVEACDKEKVEVIEKHFREILLTLGLDLTDDSLEKNPSSLCQNVGV